MKRILSIIVFLFFALASTPCYAIGQLYYIKNVQKNVMDAKMTTLFVNNDYTLKQKSPYYAIQKNDSEKYAVVVFQQSGANLFYYFTTNGSKKVNKAFLKDLSNQNITFLVSENETLINNFENIAQKTLTGTTTTYSFEDNRYSNSSATTTVKKTINDDSLSGYVASVGKGTTLKAYLSTPINTATAQAGDSVEAVLQADWVINGKTVAPQGSVVSGTLTKAHSASIGMRNGGVSINFNKVTTPDNVTYDISTQKIDFDVSNEGSVKKTVTNALVLTAIGALLGVAVAACSSDHNIGKGAMIGAGIGAGGAVISSAAQSGVDAEIPSYTELDIVIEKDLRIVFQD